jgi:hypothetical protein
MNVASMVPSSTGPFFSQMLIVSLELLETFDVEKASLAAHTCSIWPVADSNRYSEAKPTDMIGLWLGAASNLRDLGVPKCDHLYEEVRPPSDMGPLDSQERPRSRFQKGTQ